MTNHPINELKIQLDKLNIEYEYNEDDHSLVIDFAMKDRESIHPIEYKSVEVKYNKQKDKFDIEMYTYFNIRDYFELPPSTVMRSTLDVDAIHSKLLAITLKYYIKSAEADLTIINMLKDIQ